MTKYSYPVVRVSTRSKNILELWDGPHLSYKEAVRILRKRRADYPKEQFFIYRYESRPEDFIKEPR